jgi:prevent-host-death family protein
MAQPAIPSAWYRDPPLRYNLTRVVRKEIPMSKTRGAARRQDLKRPKGQVIQQEWQLQDAKARFSEVFRLARERGPQRVTKHGREAVVVITAEEYTRLAQSEACKGSLSEFFAASPLRGSGIDLDRPRDFGRDIQL